MEKKASKEIFFFGIEDGRYGFLDNFYPCKFTIGGKEYRSIEHYYQSQKAKSSEHREWIRNASSAAQAKKRGRSLLQKEIVKGWENKKISAMRKGTCEKFLQNPRLMKKLFDTKDAVLHEDSPDDVFWGAKGRDRMGKLLMEIRGKLRNRSSKKLILI